MMGIVFIWWLLFGYKYNIITYFNIKVLSKILTQKNHRNLYTENICKK